MTYQRDGGGNTYSGCSIRKFICSALTRKTRQTPKTTSEIRNLSLVLFPLKKRIIPMPEMRPIGPKIPIMTQKTDSVASSL
jgi:hypothetical protein